MPAKVEIRRPGPSCWELEAKLIPRNNDPKENEFKRFVRSEGLVIDKDHGWSARGYHTLTILVNYEGRAEKAKKAIEKWGEENLPK